MNTPCAICAIGNELLTAKIQDTNGYFLAKETTDLGLSVTEVVQISDDAQVMLTTFQRLLKTNDILILSGGLGPTDDDLTVDVLCKLFKTIPVYDKLAARKTTLFFQKNYKKKLPAEEFSSFLEKSLKQTRLPQIAMALKNDRGLAPGIVIQTTLFQKAKTIISLPGFPDELQHLWEKAKLYLPRQEHKPFIRYHNLWTIPESKAFHEIPYNPKLVELGDRALPFGCQVYVKALSFEPNSQQEYRNVNRFIKQHYVGFLYDDPIETFIAHLKKNNLTIATLESCTGGLCAKKLTDYAGISSVYKGSLVCYANEIKQRLLEVPADQIEKFGAVSAPVAQAMSQNGQRIFDVDYAIAFTGIAGPTGATADKPLGLLYISIANREGNIVTRQFHFNFGRKRFRQAAVYQGFIMLCQNFMK